MLEINCLIQHICDLLRCWKGCQLETNLCLLQIIEGYFSTQIFYLSIPHAFSLMVYFSRARKHLVDRNIETSHIWNYVKIY